MRKIVSTVAVILTALSLTACTSTQQGASVGAITGAVIGGTTSGSVGGAVVGATIGGVTGAVAGTLLGRYAKDPTQCVWEDRNGKRYLAPCSPNG